MPAEIGIIPRMTASAEWWLGRSPLALGLYSLPYRKVLSSEIDLAGLKGSDIVLNVGCGPAPFTAIMLARRGFRVIALDRDEDAVEAARNAVLRAGLEDRIDVRWGDPIRDRMPDYDVAFVALQVRPKAAVIDALRNSAKSGGRILVRDSAPWCRDMYDDLPGDLKICGEVPHDLGALDRSILIDP